MVVMNSSPYFKTGQPDTKLLWAVGPVIYVTDTLLIKSMECQAKLLMFCFNPVDSIVADFGRKPGWLTTIFLTQPCIGGREPGCERNLQGFFKIPFSYVITYTN